MRGGQHLQCTLNPLGRAYVLPQRAPATVLAGHIDLRKVQGGIRTSTGVLTTAPGGLPSEDPSAQDVAKLGAMDRP